MFSSSCATWHWATCSYEGFGGNAASHDGELGSCGVLNDVNEEDPHC